jgi:hypothetical protein
VDRGPWAAACFSGLLEPPQDVGKGVDKGVIGVSEGLRGSQGVSGGLRRLSGSQIVLRHALIKIR